MHFWSIKGVSFLQNANNLNFKLFFRLYTWPTKQVFCLYLRGILDNESFWMSPKSTFLVFKKSCPNWGRGRGGGIWTKSNRTAFFSRETVPYIAQFNILVQFTFWPIIVHVKFHFLDDIIYLTSFSAILSGKGRAVNVFHHLETTWISNIETGMAQICTVLFWMLKNNTE